MKGEFYKDEVVLHLQGGWSIGANFDVDTYVEQPAQAGVYYPVDQAVEPLPEILGIDDVDVYNIEAFDKDGVEIKLNSLQEEGAKQLIINYIKDNYNPNEENY